MKLCVLGKYPPIEGGVSTNTYWLVRGLAERGHQIHVVTNAEEVEDDYRLALRPDDRGWLEPRFANGGSVRVSSPQPYSRLAMAHIPRANPFVSKLASLATDIIRRERCEAILAYYYEPYGVAGWLASRWTDRPLIVKHAGSDLDRLFRVADLATTYKEILCSASVVVTQPFLMPRFIGMGVDRDRIEADIPYSPPTRFFQPAAEPLDLAREAIRDWIPDTSTRPTAADRGTPVIGVYGKVGIAKGTFDCLDALGRLARGGLDFRLAAMIGRAQGQRIASAIQEAGLLERTYLLPLLPNWRVPGFLRACTAACFLERDFPVAIHGPIIPREILACGTCLVLSGEIAAKQRFRESLRPGENLFVVEDPRNRDELATVLRAALENPMHARSVGERGLEISRSIERHEAYVSGWEDLFERRVGSRPRSQSIAGPGHIEDASTAAAHVEWLLPDLVSFLRRHGAPVVEAFLPPAAATDPFATAIAFCDFVQERARSCGFGAALPQLLAVLEYTKERLTIARGPTDHAAVFAVCDRIQATKVTLEATRHLSPVRGNAVRIVRFDYDLSDVAIVSSVGGHPPVGESEVDLAAIPKAPMLVLFHRSANLIPCVLRVDDSTCALVARCDGTRTTTEMIDDMCHYFQADRDEPVADRVCDALDQLYQAGVIVFGEYRTGLGWAGGVRGELPGCDDPRRLVSALEVGVLRDD